MGIQLKDVSIRTMIGQLPKILSDNNKSISDYFDKIYNSDEDCIIKNVYNKTGYVKSHLGEFTNLEVDIVNINDEASKDNIIKDRNHNMLSGRFLWNENGSPKDLLDTSTNVELKKYCHNANAIGIELGDGEVLSLGSVINDIISNITEMKPYHAATSVSDKIAAVGDHVSLYGVNMQNDYDIEQPTSFTFDNSLLFASKVQLKRMNLPQYQYDDVTSGFIYTYYDYAQVLTINDEHTASIKGLPGSEIVIKFNDTQKKAFYRILLSRSEKKYLRVSKDELVRLRLVCIGNDELNGTSWDVKDYSVRNAEDLVIERK